MAQSSNSISKEELEKVVQTLDLALQFAQQIKTNEVQFKMARADLISSAELWLDFIESRKNSSHSYDEDMAAKVFQQILMFRSKVEELVKNLKKIS